MIAADDNPPCRNPAAEGDLVLADNIAADFTAGLIMVDGFIVCYYRSMDVKMEKMK